jgi:hypothetical protein
MYFFRILSSPWIPLLSAITSRKLPLGLKMGCFRLSRWGFDRFDATGVEYRKNEIVGAEISKYARTNSNLKGRGRQTIMIAAKRRVNLILANGRLKKKIPKHKIRG